MQLFAAPLVALHEKQAGSQYGLLGMAKIEDNC